MPSSRMFFVVVLMFMLNCDRGGVQADDKNITRLLNNQVIVSRQIMCVLEKSPCDQLGRQLKGMSVLYSRTCHVISVQTVYEMYIYYYVYVSRYIVNKRWLICIYILMFAFRY